jgi:phage-related protein
VQNLAGSTPEIVKTGIWEVRIRLENRIARVLFVLEGATMVLLHGFIKKTQTTPAKELEIARKRLKEIKHD